MYNLRGGLSSYAKMLLRVYQAYLCFSAFIMSSSFVSYLCFSAFIMSSSFASSLFLIIRRFTGMGLNVNSARKTQYTGNIIKADNIPEITNWSPDATLFGLPYTAALIANKPCNNAIVHNNRCGRVKVSW